MRLGLWTLLFLLALTREAFPDGGVMTAPPLVLPSCSTFLERVIDRVLPRSAEPPKQYALDTLPDNTLTLLRDVKGVSLAHIRRLVDHLPQDLQSRTQQQEEMEHLAALRDSGRLKDPRKIELLIALELRAGRTRETVEEQRRDLRSRLASEDPARRLAAVRELTRDTTEAARLALQKALTDSDVRVRNAARLVLSDRGDLRPGPEDIVDLAIGVQNASSDALALLPRLSNADMARLLAVPGLAQSLAVKPRGALGNRDLDFVKTMLVNPDPAVRALALEALRQRYEADVLELLKTVRHDGDPLVRARLVEALAERRDPESLALWNELDPGHASVGATHPSARPWTPTELVESRLHAADEATQTEGALALWGQPTRLIDLALGSPFPKVRVLAAKALLGRQDPAAIEAVERAARDPVVEVRLAALMAANAIRDPRGIAILRQAQNDPHQRVYTQADRLLTVRRPLPLLPEAKDLALEALEAARNVYNVPEIGRHTTPAKMVDEYERFLDGVPLGYAIASTVAEARTGLKFAYYKPRDSTDGRPAIFAIGGTQGYMDLLADLNLGARQRKSPALLAIEKTLLSELLLGRDVVITGHSLGGGLAQAVAYDLAKATMGKPGFGRVLLVTWNGFGGKELIERTGTYSPDVASAIDARNYYVPGDPVSRIGTHVGPVFALAPIRRLNPIGYHVMDGVEESAYFKGGLQEPTPGPPFLKFRLSTLFTKGFGWVGDLTQMVHYRRTQRQVVETLVEARLEWARRRGYAELSPEYEWLDRELETVLKEISSQNLHPLKQYIEEKELERQRILAEKRRPGA